MQKSEAGSRSLRIYSGPAMFGNRYVGGHGACRVPWRNKKNGDEPPNRERDGRALVGGA